MTASLRHGIERRAFVAPPLTDVALSPLLRDLYRRRGVRDAAELNLFFAELPAPAKLDGLEAATRLLLAARDRRAKICFIGDYDADGASGCALGMLGLRAMGFADLSYIVPDRRLDGYGLTPALAERAAAEGARLIITVDNGTTALEGVAAARAAGLEVIVTDHHLPAAQRPDADAIVNPKLSPDFGGANLAGVGVIFYLLIALRAALRERGAFAEHPGPDLRQWLDLVALGTVADMVSLDHCNRILVRQGLNVIRRGRGRPGLNALLDCARRACAEVDEETLAFAVAPRINAAGRLDDISLSIECLLVDDAKLAGEHAATLDAINRERRAVTARQRVEAETMLAASDDVSGELPAGLCVHQPHWHVGVIGLIASHLARRHHRPTIALALDEEGSLTGSVRSIDGVHVRDVLEAVHVREGGMLRRFGGHAQAAGLSVAAERLDDLKRAFAREVDAVMSAETRRAREFSDGELASADISIDTVRMLDAAGPWGMGFPAPCFDGRFTALKRRWRGRGHLMMRLRAADGAEFDAVWFDADVSFRPADEQSEAPPLEVEALYQLSIDEWQGMSRLRLMVRSLAEV